MPKPVAIVALAVAAVVMSMTAMRVLDEAGKRHAAKHAPAAETASTTPPAPATPAD